MWPACRRAQAQAEMRMILIRIQDGADNMPHCQLGFVPIDKHIGCVVYWRVGREH